MSQFAIYQYVSRLTPPHEHDTVARCSACVFAENIAPALLKCETVEEVNKKLFELAGELKAQGRIPPFSRIA